MSQFGNNGFFYFIGGAKIYSARTIKVKDQEDIRLFLLTFKGILQ
jgi:hypothetical protein